MVGKSIESDICFGFGRFVDTFGSPHKFSHAEKKTSNDVTTGFCLRDDAL